MAYSLLTGCLNAFTNLYFLLGFSSGPFSVGSSSKSKLGRKYDWKESYCNNILSKHFRKLNQLVKTWFITFLTSLLLRLINCFFVLHPTKMIVYANNQILRIYKKFFGYFPQHTNVVNDKGNQRKNPLATLCTLYFLKEAVTLSNHKICIIKTIRYAIIPVHLKGFFYFIAHITHHAVFLTHC